MPSVSAHSFATICVPSFVLVKPGCAFSKIAVVSLIDVGIPKVFLATKSTGLPVAFDAAIYLSVANACSFICCFFNSFSILAKSTFDCMSDTLSNS
jgi:hypothetical protein